MYRILSILSKTANVQPFVVFNSQTRAGGLPDRGFDLLSTPLIQQTDLFRAANKFIAPRFNVVDTWKFKVVYSFSGAVQTVKFIAGLRASVPLSGELQYQINDQGQNYILYCPSVVRGPLQVNDRDGSVDVDWNFVLNANWTNTP